MTDAPRRGRLAVRLIALTLLASLGVALLVGLGLWQLQRKAWKEDLLHRIAALQTAPAEPLAVVLNRAADPAAPGRVPGVQGLDFTRVQTLCSGLPGRGLHLYGLRADGPGWRQIAACALPPGLPYRTLLVDLGFERLPPVSQPALQAVTLPARDASVVGVLRTPDPPAWTDRLIGPPDPADAHGQWMRRDIPGMAHALGAPDPAPFMLELETPVAGPGLIPSPLPAGSLNQTMLAGRGPDLVGVARRDGSEALAVVRSRSEAGHAKVGVVDGEDDSGPPQAIGLVVLPEGLRHAGCAPVVAVQDVRLTPCLQQKLQRSLQASTHESTKNRTPGRSRRD